MTRSVSLSRGSPEPRVTGQPPCLCAVLRASAGLGNSALAGPWKQARLDILQICRLGCLLNALEFFRSGTSCMAWVCRACKNNTWKPQHASESFDLMLPRQGKARRCLWSENESLETFLVSSCPHPHDERGDSHLQHQTSVVSGHSNSPSACPRACHGLDTALGTRAVQEPSLASTASSGTSLPREQGLSTDPGLAQLWTDIMVWFSPSAEVKGQEADG